MLDTLTLKDILGLGSVACSFFGYGSYIWSIFRSGNKPHALTWIVWTILMAIVFTVQMSKGAGPGCWVTGVSAGFCGVISGFALWRGEKSIKRSDWVAFTGALIAIPLWRLTDNPLLAVVIATIIDAMAYYPTYRKSWFRPDQENFVLYTIDIMKWVIAFFALTDISIVTLLYPVFCLSANAGLVAMILARRSVLKTSPIKNGMAIVALVLMLGVGVSHQAHAEVASDPAYSVTDVAVDVAADSAAHARDQAIVEAQRSGFSKLLERFSADPALAIKLKPDDLATLVKNFEVQSEHASSVRYIGIFTLQFRPNAVRKFLANHGVAAISDARSKPVVILPIYLNASHPILWEQVTRWRTAWDKSPHDDGLVPVILPVGDLDDIGMLSTDEAVKGKPDNVKAFAAKYQAGGVDVVTLKGNVDDVATALAIDIARYDTDGNILGDVEHLTLDPIGKTPLDDALAKAVHMVHHALEKDWQEQQKQPIPSLDQTGNGNVGGEMSINDLPTLHLPVSVPITSLAEWAHVRGALSATQGIARVNVVTMGRNEVMIELELTDSIEDTQAALLTQHLQLKQDLLSQAWVLGHI